MQVAGFAHVTSIEPCPRIASGEGSVVTARFITREVNSIVRAEIIGPDGKIEVIEGTPIHPIWSVDCNDWVPLGELAEGESLQGLDGLAVVLSITLSRVSQPVYNLEVHGEHVYQVGEMGVLVHNACDDFMGGVFKSGELFEKTFETSQGKVGFLAETIIKGKTLYLKDVVIEPVRTGVLKVGVREVTALKDQLIAQARASGFNELIITGERLTGANPGKIVELIIDLTK